MGFLDRLLGKQRAGHDAAEADRARSTKLAGQEIGQTVMEQAATRGRMEAEMDEQRARRQQPPAPSV